MSAGRIASRSTETRTGSTRIFRSCSLRRAVLRLYYLRYGYTHKRRQKLKRHAEPQYHRRPDDIRAPRAVLPSRQPEKQQQNKSIAADMDIPAPANESRSLVHLLSSPRLIIRSISAMSSSVIFPASTRSAMSPRHFPANIREMKLSETRLSCTRHARREASRPCTVSARLIVRILTKSFPARRSSRTCTAVFVHLLFFDTARCISETMAGRPMSQSAIMTSSSASGRVSGGSFSDYT